VAGASEMLLRIECLSLDPYMRGRMNNSKSYREPAAIGAPMVGGAVAGVVTSDVQGFTKGDWVLSFNGWHDYAVSDGVGVSNMGTDPTHPSRALGIIGLDSLTAYCGLLEIGAPKAGETVVTVAAISPVGATVGQIAKIK
jgi:NADPH-dependent curcumin reductase CurA